MKDDEYKECVEKYEDGNGDEDDVDVEEGDGDDEEGGEEGE
jgi:hypothetical protein